MTVTVIFIIAICVAAAIGAIIGIFKKATELSFWGATVLLSVLVARLIAKFVSSSVNGYAFILLGSTVGAAIIFIFLFAGIKKFLAKRIKNAREYSKYKNKDAVEENEAYIMNAVDNKDKRSYRKLRKKGRKIKNSSGGWGVVNRLLGFVAGGLDWLMAVGSILCALLLFTEFCGIPQVGDFAPVKELISSDGWVNLGSKYALDIILVGIFVITIKSGFSKGIFHLITPIVVLGMLVGFGYASWAIASSSACEGIVNGLCDGLLSSVAQVNADLSVLLAKIIITAVIFLLSLIIVVMTGILLPKLLNKFRDNDAFYVIDGIFGAIISGAVLLVAVLAVGGVAYTLSDLEFIQKFNGYEAKSAFANCFYEYNPFASMFVNLPLRGWLEPKAA